MRQEILTFVHTDIEGSTQLLHRLGPNYVEALQTHRRLLGRVASDFDGACVDSVGDSVLLVFRRADDAARAALVAQLTLAALHLADEEGLRVRIGLATGPVWRRGRSYYGLPLHKAARISALAYGGQILISAETAAALDPSAPLRALADAVLNGFDDSEMVYELVVGDPCPAEAHA